MNKEPIVFIQHILENIESLESYFKGVSKDKFLKDILLQDAAIRRLEIIGESVKNLPQSFRKEYPNVSWEDITGTRDKLIHHYFGVDLDLTFGIIINDLPKLKEEIKKILKNLSK
jgi:uncharacterized protein with HEPN domain